MKDSTLAGFPGRCTCGFVRFEMASKPLVVHGCHCRWCQRQSGGAFAVNAVIEADRVKLVEGTVHAITVDSPSGRGQRIFRCPKCEIALWSNYLVGPGKLSEGLCYVRVGTLERPDMFPPDVHIYTEDKQPWFVLPSGVPAVEKFYRLEDVYSVDSRARLAALSGRST